MLFLYFCCTRKLSQLVKQYCWTTTSQWQEVPFHQSDRPTFGAGWVTVTCSDSAGDYLFIGCFLRPKRIHSINNIQCTADCSLCAFLQNNSGSQTRSRQILRASFSCGFTIRISAAQLSNSLCNMFVRLYMQAMKQIIHIDLCFLLYE